MAARWSSSWPKRPRREQVLVIFIYKRILVWESNEKIGRVMWTLDCISTPHMNFDGQPFGPRGPALSTSWIRSVEEVAPIDVDGGVLRIKRLFFLYPPSQSSIKWNIDHGPLASSPVLFRLSLGTRNLHRSVTGHNEHKPPPFFFSARTHRETGRAWAQLASLRVDGRAEQIHLTRRTGAVCSVVEDRKDQFTCKLAGLGCILF